MTADQLNTEIQLDRTSGWVATSLSNPAKCEAQAARADLGMCLIACTVGGDQTSLTVGDAMVFSDGVSLLEAIGIGWFRHALDCVPASNGVYSNADKDYRGNHACEFSRLLNATDV